MTHEWLVLGIFSAAIAILWFVFQRSYVKFERLQESQVENEKKIIEITANLSNAIKSSEAYQTMNNDQLKQINEALKKQIESMEKLTHEIAKMSVDVSKIEQMIQNYPKIEQRVQEIEIQLARLASME